MAHLGAIRSLATAIGVLASALGPVTLATLMDHGLPIETGCLLFATYATIRTLLMGNAPGVRITRLRP